MVDVSIIKVTSDDENWTPSTFYQVVKEGYGSTLFQSDTQKEAIDWAKAKGHNVKIHRVRNRDENDQYGQYRDH